MGPYTSDDALNGGPRRIPILDQAECTIDLPTREKQVIVMLAQDCTTNDIMVQLHISKSYTYHIIGRLMCRFNVRTRSALVANAIAKGLVVPSRTLQKQVQFVAG